MRKLTKVVSALAIVVTIGSLKSVVQASPAPPVPEPDKVVSLGVDSNTLSSGPVYWGSETVYNLKVIDKNGDLYSLGRPYEAFGTATYTTDPTIKAELKEGKVLEDPNGPTKPWPEGGTFQDHDATYILFDSGANTFWFSFPQTWHDIRVSDYQDFTLNTQTVTQVQNYAFRSD